MSILSRIFSRRSDAPGVYRIRNIGNGAAYVGSTIRSIRMRWQEHRDSLNQSIHHNKALQDDWNYYGEESFAFEVIEIVRDRETILDRESYWQSQERLLYKSRAISTQSYQRHQRKNEERYYPDFIKLSDHMSDDGMLVFLSLLHYADGTYVHDPAGIARLLMSGDGSRKSIDFILDQIADLRSR